MKKLISLTLLVGVAIVNFALTGCSQNKEIDKVDQLPIGIQLWSVQDKLKQDFEGTIKSLAAMGFDAVELAGVFGQYGNNPKGLKAFLAKQGLIVSGAHVGFDQLSEEKIEQTLDFYKQLGANYLIIPWDERAWHPTGVIEMVADLNRLFPIVKKAGFSFGFHNHDKEFNDFEGSTSDPKTYWDYIALNTDPNMVLQLDIGWVNYAQKDPVHYVKEYTGRTLTTHYKVRTHKDSTQSPILGEDGYNWANLFQVMKSFGGTKWIIVEQEEYPDGLNSLESVAKSKAGLDQMLELLK